MRIFAPLLAAMVAALTLVSCGKKVDPTAAAKMFFDQIKDGKTEDAYRSSAFAFQAQQSQKFFETVLKELGLAQIKSAEYQPAEFEDNGRTAKIRADFTTATEAKIPLVITLNRESGAWKVFAIKSPRNAATGLIENHFSLVGRSPDFVDAVNRQPAPDPAVTNQLILDTLVRFNESVKAGDFRDFFRECSLSWQDQLVTGSVAIGTPSTMRRELSDRQVEIGASRLQRAFQPFIDMKVDLGNVQKTEPVFDAPPLVTTDGLLIVSGYYPTEPFRIIFSMKFMYELPKWRLFGLDVSLRK